MSKSKLSNYKYPGALASLSSSVKKVLDIDGRFIDASKVDSHLDRVSTGSGSDLVKPWDSRSFKEYRMLITDQVATAPCTGPIQE